VPVALIAMTFPNEKNGMRVKPLLVSREAAQRSGGLPTLIPFRWSSRPRPSVPEHLAAQLKELRVGIPSLVVYKLKLKW